MLLRLSIALSVIALLVLAGLQYHWIDQITVTERQHLQRSVENSADDLAEDVFEELRQIADMLDARRGRLSDSEQLAERYREWAASSSFPKLVRGIYLTRPPDELLRFDDSKAAFEVTSWPPNLAPLAKATGNGQPMTLPLDADVLLIPASRRFLEYPIAEIIVELDRDVFVEALLPALVDRRARRFTESEGRNYRLAVVAESTDSTQTLFTSGEPWTETELATPDYQRDLLPQPLPQRRGGPDGPPPPRRGPPRGLRGPDPRGALFMHAGPRWRLLVKHSAGSVETAAMQFRERNLAISFGVLIILGIGTMAILVSANRARRLAKLHVDFAAGVSHELRTPLAVIQSAAHNLKTGIVRDPEGIEQYATIVQTEARRLSEMVEQVMTYSETQSGRKTYQLAALDLSDVTDAAIRNMAPALQERNATVQTRIDPGLPSVLADRAALIRCLQNLISNAVKYGRADNSTPIEIDATHDISDGHPGKVRLSVSDHGTGVPESDASHLFEAFYRGSNAGTNTPGNGLGLHLVRRMIEALNGSVTYERTREGGARFTLTIPVAGDRP